jgi:hypothetical protein
MLLFEHLDLLLCGERVFIRSPRVPCIVGM